MEEYPKRRLRHNSPVLSMLFAIEEAGISRIFSLYLRISRIKTITPL
jgi:hypothetical protein